VSYYIDRADGPSRAEAEEADAIERWMDRATPRELRLYRAGYATDAEVLSEDGPEWSKLISRRRRRARKDYPTQCISAGQSYTESRYRVIDPVTGGQQVVVERAPIARKEAK